MYWAGHLTRIEDVRLPEQLFYGELQSQRHKLEKYSKNVIKNNLVAFSVDVEDWEQMTENQLVWKK